MRKLIILILISYNCTLSSQECINCYKNTQDEVLSHYIRENDSLKLKAAKFLLKNIPYHHSFQSSEHTKIYKGIAQINQNYKYPDCIEKFDSLYSTLMNHNYRISKVSDTMVVNAKSLIKNIDMAFHDWREGNWARHLSFEDFCEYLLPYRVGSEIYEEWRESLREEYFNIANSISSSDDMYDQSYWAACKINDYLRKEKFHNKKILPQLNLELPVSTLKKIRMGECKDYAKITSYVMRACGIPVSLDFTPQWPDRANSHHWNALLDNTGYSIPFMGYESNPGYPNKQGRKMAKVYRYTFEYQPQSLFAINTNVNEQVPDNLNTPFIKDVSMEYFKGHNVSIRLTNARLNEKIAYIAVFDNHQWIPVDFSTISNSGTAIFKNMGSDIVYLPVLWRNNEAVAAGEAFILKNDGSIQTLHPNLEKRQDIVIKRKYPLFNRIIKYRMLLKNGYFEASNSCDFKKSVRCADIKKMSLFGFDTLAIKQSGKFQYWRFVSPENGKCNIAEIIFLSKGEKIEPIHILSIGEPMSGSDPQYAFDGNRLSYYESMSSKNGWVGVDFGKPVAIDEIAYLPRNDANDVEEGHFYELSYFSMGEEVSICVQKATNGYLVFKDVPCDTIYILHDLTEGNEERIFTYENKQIKWF